MNSRILPILNAIGCLVLTGLVVVQWWNERKLNGSVDMLGKQLGEARQLAADEASRRSALERDIAALKEAISSTQQAAESSASDLSTQLEANEQLKTALESSRQQVVAWEEGIKVRDERIGKLEADLVATRKRLDEAIAKLKAAGAR